MITWMDYPPTVRTFIYKLLKLHGRSLSERRVFRALLADNGISPPDGLMSRTTDTERRDADILSRHLLDHQTPVTIAKSTGVPRATVVYVLEKYGYTPHRNRPKSATRGQVDQATWMLERRRPMTEVAKETGMTYDQVRYLKAKLN